MKNPDVQATQLAHSSPNAENAASLMYGSGAEWPNQVSGDQQDGGGHRHQN